jgi:RNA polymerase sigma-70 factor (ECF subfamily)
MNELPTTHPSLLVRLANRDDRVAWEEFTRMVTPVLRRIAVSRGLQSLDADELVQEVLVSVMHAIDSFEPSSRRGSFRGWLLTVARNAAINKLSRRPRDQRLRDGSVDLHQLCRKNDIQEVVESAMEREWQSEMFVIACQTLQPTIQPNTWSAFWKTAVEGKDGESAAKELGMSVGAVYVARSRTLAKLKAWVLANSKLWTDES